MCATAHVWRPEDSSKDLVLSFYHVGPRDRTQVVGLGGKPAQESLLSVLGCLVPFIAFSM